MNTDDFPRYKEIMRGMAAVHGIELDNLTLDAYWMVMRRWSLADFERVSAHLLETLPWMPKPSHYREIEQAGQPTAGEAWEAVLEHCKGGYRIHPKLDDDGPIDRAVGALGGYRHIAMTDQQYLGILGRNFAEHYQVQTDRHTVRALPLEVGTTVRLGKPTSLASLIPNLDKS